MHQYTPHILKTGENNNDRRQSENNTSNYDRKKDAHTQTHTQAKEKK